MKRIRYASEPGLLEAERNLLLRGEWFCAEPEPTPERQAELWKEHGETLTGEWVTAHPFSRPRFWWIATGNQRRRIRNRLQKGSGPTYYGIPESEMADEGDFESQGAMLERLGLLTDTERELLPLTPWQRLGMCDVAGAEYFERNPDLLRGPELKALKAHLRERRVSIQ
jgi:hypothetical protein